MSVPRRNALNTVSLLCTFEWQVIGRCHGYLCDSFMSIHITVRLVKASTYLLTGLHM